MNGDGYSFHDAYITYATIQLAMLVILLTSLAVGLVCVYRPKQDRLSWSVAAAEAGLLAFILAREFISL